MKHPYVTMLIDVLKKKIRVLEQCMLATKEQIVCLEQATEQGRYEDCSRRKLEYQQEWERLEDGFLRLYERAKEILITNASEYQQEGKQMQTLIRTITDQILRLQKLEDVHATLLKASGRVTYSNQGMIKPSKQTAVASYQKTMKQWKK